MKGLTWVGAFVLSGIATGSFVFGLTPARYRGVTTLQVTTTPDPHYAEEWRTLREASQEQYAERLNYAFSEDWIEHLMQELGLYRKEREAGRWADALLAFRRSTYFSRRVEDESSELWLIAFEADDPGVATTVSSRLASWLAHQSDDQSRESDEMDRPLQAALQFLVEQLRTADSEIAAWKKTNAGRTPPAALMNGYKALSTEYEGLLKEVVHPVGDRIHYFSREVTVVKTPRVFDWRVSPVFLPNVAMGAAAGLIFGLFTMPPFFWWRRHAP